MTGRDRLLRLRPSLGPHASRLLDELLGAAAGGHHASVIILAAAVLDVALREPSGCPAQADGLDIASARDSRDAFWLRERRNGIVHYEGGRGGLMGDDDAEGELAADGARALEVLTSALEPLIGED